MGEKRSIAALLIVVLATAVQSGADDASGLADNRDIVKFLNTSGAIYSYSITTTQSTVLCKVDFAIKEEGTEVTFKRYTPDYSSRAKSLAVGAPKAAKFSLGTTTVKGTFYCTQVDCGGKFDAMDIAYRSGVEYKEAMEFQDTEGECGIFAVTAPMHLKAAVTLDLRVRSSGENKVKGEECLRQFKESDRSKKYENIAESLPEESVCKEKCEMHQCMGPHSL
uniref:Putative lipocalin-3 1 n=1 Tax=Amblyomma cajennense TaxID=34607 RepID=A0A023FFL5_AMBCJ